jgi:hypothetical protein
MEWHMKTSNFGMQLVLPMLTRIDGPSMVKPGDVEQLDTFRQAVRFAWMQRKRRCMTMRLLAEELGSYPSHVTDYLNADDAPARKSLPAQMVAAFDYAVGNTAVSQWLAMRSNLPVMVMLDERKAA